MCASVWVCVRLCVSVCVSVTEERRLGGARLVVCKTFVLLDLDLALMLFTRDAITRLSVHQSSELCRTHAVR